MFLKPFLNDFAVLKGAFILLKETSAIREYRWYNEVYLVYNFV